MIESKLLPTQSTRLNFHTFMNLQLAIYRVVHVMVHIIVAPSCSVVEKVFVIASLSFFFLLETHFELD
jgi:hypothetical protein